MKNPHFVRIQKILGPLVRFLFPITLEGAENLPDDRPVMLCANHSSAWDPILFVAAIWTGYPLRIMAKKQLLRIPILGSILKAIGVFAVDRGNSDILAVKTAIQSLKQGWNLLIFPEGTRVKNPGQAEVKGGAAMMAIRSGVDMVPMFIDTKKRLFRRVRIIIGRPYSPVYTGRKGTAEEYQANADEIMRRAYATVCAGPWSWRRKLPGRTAAASCWAASSTTPTWWPSWNGWGPGKQIRRTRCVPETR